MTYEEAVREINAEICWRDGEPVKGDLTVLVPANTLRALLAGPPEPSVEEVARVISSNPAFLAEVRDEQQTWLADHLAEALASRPDGWRGIESAPRDRPFWARKANNEIALCWRHNPSSRTDEVVTWTGNQGFKAVEWRYPDPLPPAPQPDE